MDTASSLGFWNFAVYFFFVKNKKYEDLPVTIFLDKKIVEEGRTGM